MSGIVYNRETPYGYFLDKPMTSSPPFLSIIVPAHNEETRLLATLEQIRDFLRPQPFVTELLIIENASTDRTLEIAQQFAREFPGTTVLHDDRPGKGLAVQTGMLAARGEFRFICDADLSMPIEEILKFLPPRLSQVDIGIASREAPGAVRYDEPVYRHWVGRIFNTMVRWLVLPGLQDSQCGFKCFTKEAAEKLFPFQTIYGWTFDVEILAIARKLGFKIVEVPIPWYYHGSSKVRVLQDSMHMAHDLLKIRRNLRNGIYARKN
jgi:dolichyl-phosphate beta-glucosyltransferase